MDRNTNHFTESSAKCPLRPKEMKFDFGGTTNDDRFSETVGRSDERRGFRPAPKLQALHLSRGRGRGGAAVAAPDGANSNNNNNNNSTNNNSSNVNNTSAGEVFGALMSANVPLTDTPMKDSQLQMGGAHPTRSARRRSLEFALTASPQLRLKAKAHAAGRHLRISETMPAPHARSLWVEGNSVLNTESGVASSALAYLSECVARERQIKEEWEAARFAKVQAFRAVVKVYMMSFTDAGDPRQSQSGARGITDTLAVARCSVVTNALVGTIQSFARAFRSRQIGAARGTLPSATTPFRPATSSTDFALSFNSAFPPRRISGDDPAATSQSYSTSDTLDREEVSRLKQLYFDYFDCEAVSISTVTPTGNESSMFDMASATSVSRPTSGSFMEDVDEFAQCASRTM